MPSTTRSLPRIAVSLALLGTALVAFGSVRALPASWPGQIVLSVFTGALLLFLGSVHLALALALRVPAADAVVAREGRAAGGLGAALEPVASLGQHRWLRWSLVAVFVAVAAGALLLVASDVWAYETLRWAIPRGGGVFIVG
jgi:uncharacterized membrane protein